MNRRRTVRRLAPFVCFGLYLLMGSGIRPAPWASAQVAPATRDVLFLLHRQSRLDLLDPVTLESLGSFATDPYGDALGIRGDGRVAFLMQASPRFGGCCSLQALNLETHEICLVANSISGSIEMAGRFASVGAGGELFDSFALTRTGPAKPLSRYKLSATGRWMVGAPRPSATGDNGPVVVSQEMLAIAWPSLPAGAQVLGWVGDDLYFGDTHSETMTFWRMTPPSASLSAPMRVRRPFANSEGRTVARSPTAKGLLFYEHFGQGLNMVLSHLDAPPDGAYLVDPVASTTGYWTSTITACLIAAAVAAGTALLTAGAAQNDSLLQPWSSWRRSPR